MEAKLAISTMPRNGGRTISSTDGREQSQSQSQAQFQVTGPADDLR